MTVTPLTIVAGVEPRSHGIALGIDVGMTGAIAVFDERMGLVEVHDMPCLGDGPKNRRTVNAPLLAQIVFDSHAKFAYVEHVGVRPGEGAVGAFAFGRSRGVIEGVLAAASISVRFLTPPSWKTVVGLPSGKTAAKDQARAEAIRRWPDKASLFKRAKDDGRADAALIGIAGMIKHG